MRNKTFTGAGSLSRSEAFRPQLTSLIDVMTILLVFLIKSFSAEGSLITVPRDIAPPVSVSSRAKPPHVIPTVSVSREHVLFNDSIVATVRDIDSKDSLSIEPLFERIRAMRGDGRAGEAILIQADRLLPFHTVKKVMYTCNKAGCRDFSFLVIHEG